MHRISTVLPAVAAAIALAVPSGPAQACGGFFCNNTPVDQSGEDILFAVDEEAGTVTTHVQIAYEGSAEDFAWIVPVPQVPELFLSTDDLFSQLESRFAAQFWMDWSTEGECDFDDVVMAEDASYSGGNTTGGGSTVNVIETQTVGPYDTVTLQADSADGLLTWLQDHGYDLPDDLDPVLTPYVDSEAYFVALRLQNDRDVGELAPLGMTYDAGKAMIPIQLTSIAATQDMRLQVYILGQHRAVPDNYLHVRINEAAIDWWNYGANYDDVITLAADEAGGQAFATDYSGSTSTMHGILYSEGRYDLDRFDGITSPIAFMDEIMDQGFPPTVTLLNLLRIHIPMPDSLPAGVSENDFYNCLECYDGYLVGQPFDGAAFAADIETFLIGPGREADQMLRAHTQITRLTSSMSPLEMTMDPGFVFNPDMDDVSQSRTARLVTECEDNDDWDEADRRLELPDGRVIYLPPLEWMQDHGMTDFEFIQELTGVNAQVIEKTGSSGQPEILSDHTDDLNRQTHAFNERMGVFTGFTANSCGGCSATGAPPAVGWLALFGLALVRRRRG